MRTVHAPADRPADVDALSYWTAWQRCTWRQPLLCWCRPRVKSRVGDDRTVSLSSVVTRGRPW